MRQRRRAERGQFDYLRPRTEPVVSRRETESRKRQLLLLGVGVVVFLIVAMLAYGWFTSFYQPPRKTIATVLGSPVKLAEVVPYTVLDSTASNGSLRPDASTTNLVRDKIVRHYAGELGVEVTDEELNAEIVRRFEPAPPGATESADALSENGRRLFDSTLEALGVTESQYRTWLRGGMYVDEVRAHFQEQVPETAEQVHVEWIVGSSRAQAQEALDRIEAGEDFLEVAADFEDPTGLSENGVLGWVPEGALAQFDAALFSDDLELNTVQGPLTTSIGSVLVRVTEGPEEREVSDRMAAFMANNDFSRWLDRKAGEAELDGPNMTNADGRWVIDQIV